jgi:predicted secreted protein
MKPGQTIKITQDAKVLSVTSRDAYGRLRPVVIVAGAHSVAFLP